MAKPEKKDKKAEKTKGTTSKVQKAPQVLTKAPITSTEILAKATDKGKAIAKPEKKKAPKEAKSLLTTAANGKLKTQPKDASSSEESTESSSEDEKPKAAQVKSAQMKVDSTSDSSDSDSSDDEDEQKKTKITPSTIPKARPKYSVAKSTPVKLEQSKLAESESDSSDSDEPVKGSKPTPAKIEKTLESSSDESPSSDEESDIQAKNAPLVAVSESSSDESDFDEEPKAKVASTKTVPPKTTVSSSDDSEEESEKDIKAKSSPSSDDESSEEDEDGDVKMADARAPAPTSGKRKATEDVPVSSKKVKVADEHAAPMEEKKTGKTKTIFVGRLSWAVDSDRLAEEFAKFGSVVSANVQCDRNTGKSRGFGFVTFNTAEAAEKALTMSGQEIDGRPVNVDLSEEVNKSQIKEKRAKAFGDTTSPPSATLFVGNLSFSTTEDAVWAFFDNYAVKNVRLPTERETGRMKGFGYVEFEDVESAKKAFEESKDAELDGRSIRLDFSQPRDPAGGGGRFDRGGGRGQSRGRGRGRGGDRGGDRGWRGRGGGRGAPRGGNARSGGIASYEGKKITF